jgi:hypothetical protein
LAWLIKEQDIAPHIRSSISPTEPTAHFPAPTSPSTGTRPLHVPRRQKAGSIPTHIRHSQKRRHCRGHKSLSRQQIGLRRLRAQGALLPQRSRAQDPTGSARRRPRGGPCARRNAGICAGLSPSKENRDAVRAPQADLRLTRLRLRGTNGANDEFLLADPKPETIRPTKGR